MNVKPATTYEAAFAAGATGLVGTIALGVTDNQGATVDPLSTGGIIEWPAGSGIYAATRTSPDSEGQYTLLWSLDGTTNPDQVTVDDLVVTSSAPGEAPTGDIYTTVDELFRVLHIRNPTADQTAAAEQLLIHAAGEINSRMGRLEDLPGWGVALAADVNLERGAELWKEQESQFGVIGLGSETGPIITGRRSRALAKLAPLQQSWGVS